MWVMTFAKKGTPELHNVMSSLAILNNNKIVVFFMFFLVENIYITRINNACFSIFFKCNLKKGKVELEKHMAI